jgi:hypothetical protein
MITIYYCQRLPGNTIVKSPYWPLLGPRFRSEFGPLGVVQAPTRDPNCEELGAQVLAAGLRVGTWPWPTQREPNSVINYVPNNGQLVAKTRHRRAWCV